MLGSIIFRKRIAIPFKVLHLRLIIPSDKNTLSS